MLFLQVYALDDLNIWPDDGASVKIRSLMNFCTKRNVNMSSRCWDPLQTDPQPCRHQSWESCFESWMGFECGSWRSGHEEAGFMPLLQARAELAQKRKSGIVKPCILNKGLYWILNQYLDTSTGLCQWSMGFTGLVMHKFLGKADTLPKSARSLPLAAQLWEHR